MENARLGERPAVTLAAAALVYAFSIVLIDIAPFYIGIYIDYLELSLSRAGYIQTIDQAGGVLGAITGFFLMPRVTWRKVLIFAGLMATIANVFTALVDTFTTLAFVRFLSGFSVVLITTISACILARAATPDRAFGAGLAMGMGFSAAAIWVLDWLRADFGYATSLGSGAIWLGAGVLLTFLLPASLGEASDLSESQLEDEETAATHRMGRAALIALGLFGISVNVVYGYVERVGLANNLDPSGVASALAFGYIFSALGSLVPGFLGAVGGRLKWIAFTTLLFFAALFALYASKTVVLYTIAFGLYASVWNMGLAYYMSLTAENDPKHQYTRAMYIMTVAAQSIGPAIAATVLTGAPLYFIFVISPAPALIAAALVIGVSFYNVRTSSANTRSFTASQ